MECSLQNRECRFHSVNMAAWLRIPFQKLSYLCNFAQSPSLLSEIDDNPASTFLCLLNCFLNAED